DEITERFAILGSQVIGSLSQSGQRAGFSRPVPDGSERGERGSVSAESAFEGLLFSLCAKSFRFGKSLLRRYASFVLGQRPPHRLPGGLVPARGGPRLQRHNL